MKHAKRLVALLLAMLLALGCLTGACAEPAGASGAPALQVGDVIHGFTVAEAYDSAQLNSTIYTFDHTFSGATLVYVQNDDPEVAFSIGYHTPYVDETDTNHVFEHAIITSSDKYPSSNLFFDLDSRTYNTYINARTMQTITFFPFSSLSEDQLIKMIDVYMSCMVAPTVLTDERYFRREAIRYELDDPSGDITLNGTVYAEDSGFLTNDSWNISAAIADALYPGETASNMIGLAHFHYKDLTYEHMIEAYERCYHFDNSLIFLYGDLDLDRILGFLDDEYLSKYPVYGTDLSAWVDGPTEPGFVDVQVQLPAYEGDVTQNSSSIIYAVSLADKSDVELYQYDILANLLNDIGSPLKSTFKERGIENAVSVEVMPDQAKPYLCFWMDYADPEQKDAMKEAVDAALATVAEKGVDPALLETMVKSMDRTARLQRNSSSVGQSIVQMIMIQWARSGDPNYCRTYEQAMDALCADAEQTAIRRMAGELLAPTRSALVTAVPTPGLAEQYEQELAEYLAEMKASMTQEELEALVARTAEFNEWNLTENHNNDFLIDPGDLPDPPKVKWRRDDRDGVAVYRGETTLEGVGKYKVYFDVSDMSRDEIMMMIISLRYFSAMKTSLHTVAELSRLRKEYLDGLGVEFVYPNEEAGENHRPMIMMSWTSLTEDFEESLALLLEQMTQADFSDAEALRYYTAVNMDSMDMSRWSGVNLCGCFRLAGAGLYADEYASYLDLCGQDCYDRMTEIAERLNAEEGYAAELAAQFDSVRRKTFTRNNLVFMVVAPEDETDGIIDHAIALLSALPEKEGADTVYVPPEMPKSLAICIEDSENNSTLVGDYMADPEFIGEYMPFVYALYDRYSTPTFRFKLGAYAAETAANFTYGFLHTTVYSDPNVRKTVEALRAMSGALKDMTLTQADLDGFILNAYAAATWPWGALDEVMNVMDLDFRGADNERIYAICKAVKNAKLSDQAAAAEHIGAVIENSALYMVGNEALIRADADCFDEVISWRHGDTGP